VASFLGFAEIRKLVFSTRGSVRFRARKQALNRELMYNFEVRGALRAPSGAENRPKTTKPRETAGSEVPLFRRPQGAEMPTQGRLRGQKGRKSRKGPFWGPRGPLGAGGPQKGPNRALWARRATGPGNRPMVWASGRQSRPLAQTIGRLPGLGPFGPGGPGLGPFWAQKGP